MTTARTKASAKPARLQIDVQNASSSQAVPSATAVRAWVRRAVAGARGGAVTVRIVDSAESAALNGKFRGTPRATNVLAFPAGIDVPPQMDELPPLGDLVVCAAVLEREAKNQGKALDAHWAHICIHGSLHLLGFDHDDDADAQRMEAREAELLASLGFENPYSGEL